MAEMKRRSTTSLPLPTWTPLQRVQLDPRSAKRTSRHGFRELGQVDQSLTGSGQSWLTPAQNNDYSVVEKFDVDLDTVFCSGRTGNRANARSCAATTTNHTPEVTISNTNIETGTVS